MIHCVKVYIVQMEIIGYMISYIITIVTRESWGTWYDVIHYLFRLKP